MRTPHYTLRSQQVHQHTQQHLQHFLPFQDHGHKCTAVVLWSVLIWAAGHMRSIAAACASLLRAPSDQAVRNALSATLPAHDPLQRQLNRALVGGLPRPLTRRPQKIALDLTLSPYYGLPQHDPQELYRGAEKAGTRSFHAYATAYVIFKGCRWTLALLAVHHSDPWQDIVRTLMQQVKRAGVPVECVLLDRGFYSVEVIRYLQRARYPFIMPVIRRGHKPDHPDGPSGTWAFTTWKRSGWSSHTLRSQSGQRATVRIGVVCVRRLPPRARHKRARLRVWIYATWGIGSHSLEWVRDTYRKRFGIESSYRQLNQARIRTSSRSPLLRLLFVGIALVLRNVYVWLHWEVLAHRRRGMRRVDLDQLPLQSLLTWLGWCVEALLELRETSPSERPMQT